MQQQSMHGAATGSDKPALLNPSMLNGSSFGSNGSNGHGSNGNAAAADKSATPSTDSSRFPGLGSLQPAGASWLPASTAPKGGEALSGMESGADLDLEQILGGGGENALGNNSSGGGIWGGAAADPWQQPQITDSASLSAASAPPGMNTGGFASGLSLGSFNQGDVWS
jgi:hypothetical protein